MRTNTGGKRDTYIFYVSCFTYLDVAYVNMISLPWLYRDIDQVKSRSGSQSPTTFRVLLPTSRHAMETRLWPSNFRIVSTTTK